MWDWIIRAKRASSLLPVLETVLAGFQLRLQKESSSNITNFAKSKHAEN
jgi:hypothetical protein